MANEKMYKLIVMDLDGTLLNSYGEVSLENRKAIQYALEKNVELVLASGRDPKTIEKLSLELGIKNYLISGNGASIYDIKKQKNIYENFIDKEKALKVAQICKENSIFFNVYTTNGIITESLDFNVKVFNNENNNKPNDKKTNIEVVKDIYNYIEENEPQILKIIICDNSKIIFNNIMEKLKDVKNIEILNVEHMSKKILRIGTEEVGVEYFYTEITNKNANKWSAIEYLIKLLKVTKEETICIGDNINDYEMVKNSGLGIAMKNSALEKEKIAKYITEDNNSNGVGNAIFRYI